MGRQSQGLNFLYLVLLLSGDAYIFNVVDIYTFIFFRGSRGVGCESMAIN